MSEIYGLDLSAPCRIVSMTAELCSYEHEYKKVDLWEKEQYKEDFLKINPHHSVPVLKEGDFILTESRAISAYLATSYDKSGKLYPSDPKVKARVDEVCYFDMGAFYKAFGEVVYPVMFKGQKEIPQESKDRLDEVLGFAENMVKKTGFAAETDHLTIADVCLIATYSTMKESGAVCLEKYTGLSEWFDKCTKMIPNYEKANGEGAAKFGEMYKSKA